MNPNELKKKTIIEELIAALLHRDKEHSPDTIATMADHAVDKVLAWTPNKQNFCKELIQKLHHEISQQQEAQIKQAMQLFTDALLGKLFYYTLHEENRYLVIDKFTNPEKKQKLLKEIEIIESSADTAILYLDALERGDHRYFMQGIAGCIYG